MLRTSPLRTVYWQSICEGTEGVQSPHMLQNKSACRRSSGRARFGRFRKMDAHWTIDGGVL